MKKKLVARIKNLWRFNFCGILFASSFFCISLLPSLLPRPWLYQSIISGLSMAIGYGIGVGLSYGIRWLTEYDPPAGFKQYAWITLAGVAPISIMIYLYLGTIWQNEVRNLVGEANIGSRHLFWVLAAALLIGFVTILLGRLIRWLSQFISKQIDRMLPRRISTMLGIVLTAGLLYWLLSGVFYTNFVNTANSTYLKRNQSVPEGISQPIAAERSGSPQSLISWESLGYQGKSFVSSGPSQSQLQEFNTKVVEPIRIYAGLESATSPEARANLALAELKRTNAFSRKVLVLATATGTGWLEPQTVDSLEYLYGGDSAIVTQQYSYLPSWISFLVDKQNATDAGQALYNAVYHEWAALPETSRPKLIAYGLSLGSFGGQAAFSGVNDLRLSVDGALFVGTPNNTALWQNITTNRQPGSPQWKPTYKNSEGVRFASTIQDIEYNREVWQSPRLLYLQHGSDPVVWFSSSLLFNKPDWLNEERAPDVSPTMRWYPFVTFLQVTIDQFFGTTVPSGHGHNYADVIVGAWQAVTQPPDWDKTKTDKLQSLINAYPSD